MSEGSVLNRWRLVLGKNAEDTIPLLPEDGEKDQVLDFLYQRERSEDERQEQGGLEESCLTVPLWLNKVRRLFPRQAVEVMERHALDRYRLAGLLTDREVLEKLEPNQALLGTLLSLRHMMSDNVLDAVRRIVKKVADDLTKKMERDFRRSVLGKIDRNTPSPLRSMRNLDMKKTIRNFSSCRSSAALPRGGTFWPAPSPTPPPESRKTNRPIIWRPTSMPVRSPVPWWPSTSWTH